MAQGIFSIVKSYRVKVGSAVCHVCKINFVRTTGHFIGNLLSNSKASAPLHKILTGNFRLSLNCLAWAKLKNDLIIVGTNGSLVLERYKLGWMHCQNFGGIQSFEKLWISEAGR